MLYEVITVLDHLISMASGYDTDTAEYLQENKGVFESAGIVKSYEEILAPLTQYDFEKTAEKANEIKDLLVIVIDES